MDTEAVLDLRDTQQSIRGAGGSELYDVELLLQALLLRCGALEDQAQDSIYGETGPVGGNPMVASASRTTLRDMRRTGPLGELSEEAQMTLLGGTLYEYNPAVPPVCTAELPRTALATALSGTTSPWTLGSPVNTARSYLGSEVASEQGTAYRSPRATTPASRRGLALNELRRTLERLVDRAASLSNTNDNVRHLNSSALEAHSRTFRPATPQSRTLSMLESNLTSPHIIREGDHEDDVVSVATSRTAVPLANPPLPDSINEGPDGDSSILIGYPPGRRAQPGSNLGDTFLSTNEVSGLNDASSDALDQSVRTVFSDTHMSEEGGRRLRATDLFDDDMNPEGGLDGGLISLLRRLAVESAESLSIDEGLARTARRVFQLGAVLAGQRLSDEEIQSLPKVRFEQKEEQSCSICLEPYKSGELLTSLPCTHFFHVDCLARWFQRSTQCPLCRSHVTGQE